MKRNTMYKTIAALLATIMLTNSVVSPVFAAVETERSDEIQSSYETGDCEEWDESATEADTSVINDADNDISDEEIAVPAEADTEIVNIEVGDVGTDSEGQYTDEEGRTNSDIIIINAICGGYRITLKAEPGTFDADVTPKLHAVCISNENTIQKIEDAIVDDETSLTEVRAFDITILDESGCEIQPLREVSLTFEKISGTDSTADYAEGMTESIEGDGYATVATCSEEDETEEEYYELDGEVLLDLDASDTIMTNASKEDAMGTDKAVAVYHLSDADSDPEYLGSGTEEHKIEVSAEHFSIYVLVMAGTPDTYDVSFETFTGDEDKPEIQHVQAGLFAEEPKYSPLLAGEVFAGWFKEAECTNRWNFTEDTVQGNITLYAKFVEARMKPGYTWADKTGSGSTTYNAASYGYASSVKNIVFTETKPEGSSADWDASVDNNGTVRCYLKGTTLYIHVISQKILANEDSSYMFSGKIPYFMSSYNLFSSVKSIDGMEYLDTSDTKNMSYMFYSLTSYDAEITVPFNTEEVENMSYMFADFVTSKTRKIDLTAFYTPNLTSMERMFSSSAVEGDELEIWVEEPNAVSYESSDDDSLKENKFFLTDNVVNFNGTFDIHKTARIYSYNFDLNNPCIANDTYQPFGLGSVIGEIGHNPCYQFGPRGGIMSLNDSKYLRLDTYTGESRSIGGKTEWDPEGTEYGYWGGFTQPSYFVTFDTRGGTLETGTDNPQRVHYSECAIEPSAAWEGHEFSGWFLDEACTEAYDFSSEVYEDSTLYAGWDIKSFTVHFEPDGGVLEETGAGPADQIVVSGNTAKDPGNMKKSYGIGIHSTFIGWFTDDDYSELYDFDTPVTEDITLYAGWGDIITVYYAPNGGESKETLNKDGYYVETVKLIYLKYTSDTKVFDRTTGKVVDQYRLLYPGTAGYKNNEIDFRAKEGKDFDCWDCYGVKHYKDNLYIDLTYKEDGTVFTAQWATQVNTVKYLPGAGTGDATKYAYPVTYGDSHKVKTVGNGSGEINFTAPTGYKFAGWKDGSGNAVAAGTDITVTGNVELTAQWTKQSYTVKYLPGEGTGDATKYAYPVTYGDSHKVKNAGTGSEEINFTAPTGYKFEGWKDGSGNAVAAGTDITVTGNVTLTAQWTKQGYTVKYLPGAGTGDATKYAYPVTYGDSHKVKAVGTGSEEINFTAPTGYKFAGWKNASDTDVAAGTDLTVTGNVELTAQWTKQGYTVKYLPGAGTGDAASYTVLYGGTHKVKNVGTGSEEINFTAPTGYKFAGWKDGSGKPITAGTDITVTGNVTLTAQWTKQSYTVKYLPGAGTGDATKYAYPVTYGDSHKVKTVGTGSGEINFTAPTGYKFAGWKDGSGNAVAVGTDLTVTGNVELTAQWTKQSYTVKYLPGEGTGDATKYAYPVTYGDSHKVKTVGTGSGEINFTAPTGYKFAGWKDGDGKDIAAGAEFTVNKNTVLTAQWNSDTYYTATFDSVFGTAVPSQRIISGGTVQYPNNPSRLGYVFAGWYTEPSYVTPYDFTTPVYADITLYAKWTSNPVPPGPPEPQYHLYVYEDPSHGGRISNAVWTCLDAENHIWEYGYDQIVARDGWIRAENPYSQRADKTEWFHFDENGHMTFGWNKYSEDIWYYTEQDSNGDLGALVYGWYFEKQDRRWYYLQPITGIMAIYWNRINSKSYFFSTRKEAKEINWRINYEKAGSSALNGIWFYSTTNPHSYGSMFFNGPTPDGHMVRQDGSLIVDDQRIRYMTGTDYMNLFKTRRKDLTN